MLIKQPLINNYLHFLTKNCKLILNINQSKLVGLFNNITQIMKKIIILSILLISCATVSLQSQSFTFVRTDPNPVHGRADTTISSYAEVNNLTNAAIPILITITNPSVMAGWDLVGMCTWHNCYAPGFYSLTESCAPGPHDFDIYFNPNGIPGSGSCTVTLSYQSTSVSQDFGVVADPVGIKQISSVVKEFKLEQNYPNPFNPTTKIGFSIPKSDYVDLRVYDILGREVKSLLSQQLTAGEYEVEFDAKNLASGMYYYRLQSGDNVSVKKMTLVK